MRSPNCWAKPPQTASATRTPVWVSYHMGPLAQQDKELEWKMRDSLPRTAKQRVILMMMIRRNTFRTRAQREHAGRFPLVNWLTLACQAGLFYSRDESAVRGPDPFRFLTRISCWKAKFARTGPPRRWTWEGPWPLGFFFFSQPNSPSSPGNYTFKNICQDEAVSIPKLSSCLWVSNLEMKVTRHLFRSSVSAAAGPGAIQSLVWGLAYHPLLRGETRRATRTNCTAKSPIFTFTCMRDEPTAPKNQPPDNYRILRPPSLSFFHSHHLEII